MGVFKTIEECEKYLVDATLGNNNRVIESNMSVVENNGMVHQHLLMREELIKNGIDLSEIDQRIRGE